MDEEMKNPNEEKTVQEEKTVHTEFSEKVRAFVEEMRGKMDSQDTKKGLIVLSIDNTYDKTADLLVSVTGQGATLVELLMRAMHNSESFKNVHMMDLKGELMFSVMKGLSKL